MIKQLATNFLFGLPYPCYTLYFHLLFSSRPCCWSMTLSMINDLVATFTTFSETCLSFPFCLFIFAQSLQIGTSSFGASAHYTYRFSSKSHGRIAGRFGRYMHKICMDDNSMLAINIVCVSSRLNLLVCHVLICTSKYIAFPCLHDINYELNLVFFKMI